LDLPRAAEPLESVGAREAQLTLKEVGRPGHIQVVVALLVISFNCLAASAKARYARWKAFWTCQYNG
jgi:hypothetical protein